MKGLFLIIFLIYIANVEAKESVNISPFPYYEVVAKTNYDLGYKLGKLTAKLIKERHKMSDQMQKAYIPFYLGTEQGRRIFSHFLNNNTAVFPDYIQEIRGIAAGANIPFEHVFLENLGQEFSYYVPSDLKKYLEPPTHCSDYSINFDDDVGVCHNEDGSQFDLNRTLMAHCVIKDKGVTKSDFFSYFYAGHLPTAAIGFNNFGLGFSMNYLTPEIPEYGGYGRQFLARRLLDMKSISEAIPWVTQDHQSTGHNYQIVEVRTKKIVNIEAGPHQTQNIKYINSGESLFHGNNFLFVNIKQKKIDLQYSS